MAAGGPMPKIQYKFYALAQLFAGQVGDTNRQYALRHDCS